ncbi:SseB family protein [Streptomyces sp. NBC_01186]|uniref:SseB family protein n=1 Tax=unclassified Streptomyces TaxID=2593676 RepID=UPI002DD81B1B|nr:MULTISPECIES: SseB family protein [unclassified Streptomyces]WSB77156.1 SseB family protein [Streptomyces sp. NBC_01775]WSS14579.1 SseB family protein [Streptomyces sp. NBC_01186]
MSLRELVRDEAVAGMTRPELLAATRSARLYFQRPEEPGFLVSETVGGPVVPVFTSWEGLALFAGPCEWASTTVSDLIELLPEGVRALVDPLGPRAFVLDADTLREPGASAGASANTQADADARADANTHADADAGADTGPSADTGPRAGADTGAGARQESGAGSESGAGPGGVSV